MLSVSDKVVDKVVTAAAAAAAARTRNVSENGRVLKVPQATHMVQLVISHSASLPQIWWTLDAVWYMVHGTWYRQ